MRKLLLAAAAALCLGSCATTTQLPVATRADTVLTAAGLPSVGKLVIRGPVTIQQGSGNVIADNRKAGQRQGSAATAPAAESGNASKRSGGGLPWWVFGLVGVASIIAWEWLSHQALPLSWLPWRLARNP